MPACSTCHILTVLSAVNYKAKCRVNCMSSCVPLSVALLLFRILAKEADTDDSSVLDEIIKLNAFPCFQVLD